MSRRLRWALVGAAIVSGSLASGSLVVAAGAAAGSFDASASTTAPPDTVPPSTVLDTIPPGGVVVPTTVPPVSLTGPSVTVTPASAKVGTRVVFTAKGFQSAAITATVCGNNALSGSVDCDQPHAVSIGALKPGQEVSENLLVAHPPKPCPCVVRVTNDTGDEVATTPLRIVGHKTAPLVAPPPAVVDNRLLQLTITATQVNRGAWKTVVSNLGGAITYDVVVSVQNKTDANLHDLVATGAVGRSATDTVQAFDLAQLPPLPPGFVWTQKLRITLPAPAIGDFHWRLSVSHNGVPVTQELVTRHRPWLLIALVLFIVADIAALVIRGRLRARARTAAAAAAAAADAEAVGAPGESSPDLVGAQPGS
jgi:hypothetical protein